MIFAAMMRRNAVKLVGERSSTLDLARGRLVLINGVFILAYIMLAARAVDLTVIQGAVKGEEGYAQVETAPVAGVARADIRDRNGVLLATSLKTASLYGDALLISDAQETAKGLVKIFPELSFAETLERLQSGKRFVWLRRNITPLEQQKILELGQPGLDFKYEYSRIYPQGELAAHLIGYTNVDGRGLAGVERGFDAGLKKGGAVDLTIDVRLQHALRAETLRTMEEFSGKAAAGVIMDVTNGEILAGVSLPDFDPHEAGEAEANSVFNRLTLGVYELGSVFKIFSTAALFETHDTPMDATFDATKPIKVGRFTINDYHAEDRILTVPEVFMYSSNIGSALMGQQVGTEALRSFYEDLGLLSTLDFEIREVSQPLVPSPWREVSTLTASYGHGIATTPVQMTAAVSSIVNGGYFVKPKLLLEERDDSKGALRVVSEKTAHRMRQLLRLVVTEGTGKNANVPGFRVGGKTGTAEKIGAKGYDRKRLVSSFIGVFPMEAPRYAVFIMVDEPKGTKKSFNYATGGWVAAPAVARVVASMASILGIQPEISAPEQDLSASLKHYISESAHD